jgi:exopolysaccharide production protein ExoZ
MVARGTIATVQALRALGAFGVCIAHLSYEFAHKLGVPDILPSGIFFGEVGVDIFFVISGFIIVYSSESLFAERSGAATFLLRRLIRIVPLYWLSSTILLAWVTVKYGGIGMVQWPWWTLVADYLFVPVTHPNGSAVPYLGIAWTLLYEMFFYVVFAAAIGWTGSRTASIVATAVALLVLILAGLTFDLPQPLAYWSNPITLEFIYGMLTAVAFRSGLRLDAGRGAALAALGLAGLLVSEATLSSSLPTRGLSLGIPASLIVAAAALSPAPKSAGRTWRFALFWGEASYALYLLHPFAITLPRNLLGSRFDELAHPYLSAAMMVMLALIIAASTHLLFEKPMTALLKTAATPRLRFLDRQPATD